MIAAMENVHFGSQRVIRMGGYRDGIISHINSFCVCLCEDRVYKLMDSQFTDAGRRQHTEEINFILIPN